jgi:flavin-dependent dehydrogenase
MRESVAETTDLVVVGGGPAGLATASLAADAGMGVVLVERGTPPRDKACGEGLMPDGLALLRRLGIDTGRGLGRPFDGIRYVDGERTAEGRFPGGHGLGIRRIALHRALVRRAAEAGVDARFGVAVRGLERDGVRTDRGAIAADWVVGADGLHSAVRGWAGLDAGPAGLRRYGVRRHFRVAAWSDQVEVHWGDDRTEAYVTPVDDDTVGLAFLWSGGTARFDELLSRFPALRERVEARPAVSADRGAGPLRRRVRGVRRGRLALVGDASGYVDAITGEGLALAFHHAFALVDALKVCDLGAYARAHRRIGALPNTLTRLVLLVERHPWLRRRLMRVLASDPSLFSRLLGLQARRRRPERAGVHDALRLAWRLLLRGA